MKVMQAILSLLSSKAKGNQPSEDEKAVREQIAAAAKEHAAASQKLQRRLNRLDGLETVEGMVKLLTPVKPN